jgi:predicted nucleic acid-binding Zn ribbon protein
VADDQEWLDRARRAADELARAKSDARARGKRPAGDSGRARVAPSEDVPASGRPRRSRRPRREDPQPLRSAIDGLLAEHGWKTAVAAGSVFGRWEQIVGSDVAAHTRPERFSDGELVVMADSTAWATQVRLLAGPLVRRLNEEIGKGSVQRVVVRGPAPPTRMGPLRVRGRRKPNGDYG